MRTRSKVQSPWSKVQSPMAEVQRQKTNGQSPCEIAFDNGQGPELLLRARFKLWTLD